ncbi:MAG: hypothetical protein EOO88_27770 [Pedobacter sp.]|nr:MAG: hypothetical protein EOO88_27770 [Pedobacter sp.]
MKKILLGIFIALGTLAANAQTQPQAKKTQKKKDDYAIVVKTAEKDKINWNHVKAYFSGKKTTDTIQISVKISDYRVRNFKSEKKYNIKGAKGNIDKLVEELKAFVKDNH